MKIGIIGQGFVGNAVFQKFNNFYKIRTFDLDESKCNSSKTQVLNSEIIFLCLPTPMNKDGSCHTGIVKDMICEIENNGKTKIVVIKSTIPPGTTDEFNKEFRNISIVFNPEFLTEANAIYDYENQDRIILGGDDKTVFKLQPIFKKVFPEAKIINTESIIAETVKYLTNCFLATKVSFANEIYELCLKLNIDYSEVIKHAIEDKRIGKSHWSVPGPDGDFGFGGHCFPKDLGALIHLTNIINSTNNVLKAVEKTNDEKRKDRNWENMKGRAVI